MATVYQKILTEVSDLRKIITGNGDPKKGMLFQQEMIKESVDALSRKLDKHINDGNSGKRDKKYFKYLSQEQASMLWKWFIRTLNILVSMSVIWLMSKIDKESLEVIVKALFK